jgi:N-terminal 7TM region of histidine kinase
VAGLAGVTPQRAGRRMRPGSTAVAVVLGGLVLVLGVTAVPLARLAHMSLNAATGSVPVWVEVPAAVGGFVVAWRKPGNPLGWIFLGSAAISILSEDAAYYAVADYRLHHGGLPLGWVALLAQPSAVLGLLLLGLMFLLFPDGRPPSPRWRWVLWTYAGIGLVWITWTAVITVGAVMSHHPQVDSAGQLYLVSGDDPAAGWWNAAYTGIFLLVAVCLVASLVAQMASWRRSSGERRQQLKWLMTGSATLVAGAATSTAFGTAPIGTACFLAGLVAFSLCVGVAVLRYRLFDIDRVISRTLAYAIVTGLLVGVYAGIVLLATEVLRFRHSTVAVAAATLAAAALFNPVRRRVQKMVDRRFNRARYDADRIIAAFAARLQDAVDLDAVQADLAGSVQQALEPAHVSVWIQAGGRQLGAAGF